MTEILIDMPLHEVARAIKAMKKGEIETLALLLTEEGSDLLERKTDLENKNVPFLTRDEAFDV